jgi:hypothetical protein
MVSAPGLLALIVLPGKPALALLLPRHACGPPRRLPPQLLISETSRIVPARCRLRRLCYRFVALLMAR